MTPAAERYFEELGGLLRARNVPAGVADTFIADLQRQIHASGTHPYTEFGEPGVLADRLARDSAAPPDGIAGLPAAAAFALAALTVTTDGAIGIAQSHSPTFGIEPVFVVAIGVAFALLAAWPFVGRSRRPHYTGTWWTATAIVALLMAIPATIQSLMRLF